MPERKPLPWERQHGETDAAWDAFQRYRDLPPAERSLARLASDVVGEPSAKDRQPENVKRQLERYSSVNLWRTRVEAWDRELDRHARDQHIDEVVKMRRRHAQQMESLLVVGMQPVKELMERLKKHSEILMEMPTEDLYRMVTLFMRVAPQIIQAERQARGEPHDAPVAQQTPVVVPELQVSDAYAVELWVVLEELGVAPHPPAPRDGEDE